MFSLQVRAIDFILEESDSQQQSQTKGSKTPKVSLKIRFFKNLTLAVCDENKKEIIPSEAEEMLTFQAGKRAYLIQVKSCGEPAIKKVCITSLKVVCHRKDGKTHIKETIEWSNNLLDFLQTPPPTFKSLIALVKRLSKQAQ